MSQEVLGALITALISGSVSGIGFVVTYKSMKNNFREALKKEKTSIHIEKMSPIPYEILELLENFMRGGDKAAFLRDFTALLNTIYAYGSEEAIKIVATMQIENYTSQNNASGINYRGISFYILLATQIKSDVTGIEISPEFWLEMRVNDYAQNKDTFKAANNAIVKELNLSEKFLI